MKKIPNYVTGLALCALIIISCKKETGLSPQEMNNPAAPRLSQDRQEEGPEAAKISTTHPRWKLNAKSAIPFTPLNLTDLNGKAIHPEQMIKLSNGKKMVAKEYLGKLNELESQLNSKGYSLRQQQNEAVSQMVSDNDAPEMPAVISTVERDENLVSGSNATAPGTNRLLQTIEKKVAKTWEKGNSNTIKAIFKGEINNYAKVYSYDPNNPTNTKTEFKVTGKSNVKGVLFDNTKDLLQANAEFYAPADLTKKMTAKLIIASGSTTVFNLNDSFPQTKLLYGDKKIDVNKSTRFEVPIIAGIDFKGKLGIRGTAGLDYNVNLSRTLTTYRTNPKASLSVYAEAAMDGGFVTGGVQGKLNFITGSLSLLGSVAVEAQSAKQIVVKNRNYFAYDLKLLNGKLTCFVDVDVFGYVRRYSHILYESTGYQKSGIILDYSKKYVIANL